MRLRKADQILMQAMMSRPRGNYGHLTFLYFSMLKRYQTLLSGKDYDEEERASLERDETISFRPASIMVPHDTRVRAPVREEGVKQHLVIDVTG